jgi:hypothetical protein
MRTDSSHHRPVPAIVQSNKEKCSLLCPDIRKPKDGTARLYNPKAVSFAKRGLHYAKTDTCNILLEFFCNRLFSIDGLKLKINGTTYNYH